MKAKTGRLHSNRCLTYAFCVLGLLLALFPIYWMIISSIKPSQEVLKYPPTFFPSKITLSNYLEVWRKANWLQFFWNSISVTGIVVLGQMAFSSLAAYSFAKLEFPGRNLIFLFFLSSMMIPAVIILIPQFIIMRIIGILNTQIALILPFFFGNAFSIFFLRQFFMSVPQSMSEAAEIDGCGQFRIFWQVFLPVSKHAVMTMAMLRVVQTWNEFLWPLIVINSEKFRTVPLAISTLFFNAHATDWSGMMTACCIGLVPLGLLFVFAKDYLMESMTMSGFK